MKFGSFFSMRQLKICLLIELLMNINILLKIITILTNNSQK
jgi:hypothetical protein